MAFDTAGNIVSDAAIELGLVAASLADAYGATDPLLVQLRSLLTSAGQELVRERAWTYLQREETFTTDGSGSYALPADFRSMIEQSGWNRSTRIPLGGPLSPQEWQYLSVLPAVAPLTVLFRPGNGVLRIYADVAGKTVAYEYRSNYWVRAAAALDANPTSDAPTANDDVVMFDRLLAVRALKLAWLQEKGLPSNAAFMKYGQTLEAVKADDSLGRPLQVAGCNTSPLLGAANIPDTGFGT